MDLTVIVCTYNRCANLARCVDALSKQSDVEARKWEVLIVDNNSNDATRQTVADLADQYDINLRYTFEGEQGLNYARNRGLKEALGTYIAYVDDDITVSPRWLFSLLDSFETFNADAAGGRIHLEPNIVLPKWIRTDTDMLGFLGYQDFGDEREMLDGKKRYPFGGNMAFNRRVVEKIGHFNTKLGRKGEGKSSAELFKGAETDYFHRLADSGASTIVYCPDAIVYHQIMPFQLKKRYFRTIHFNAGYQKAKYDDRQFPVTLFRVPRFYYRQLLGSFLKYIWQVISKGPDWAFRQQMTVAHTLGLVLGYRKEKTATGS